jgi:hypothetical protein
MKNFSFDNGFSVGSQNALCCHWSCSTECQENSIVFSRAFSESSDSHNDFLVLRNCVERQVDFLVGQGHKLDDVLFVQEATQQSA